MFELPEFQSRRPLARRPWLPIGIILAAFSPAGLTQPWVGDNAYCYALADGGDQLISMRKDGTNPIAVGGGAGVGAIEAIAFDPRALVNPDGNPTACGVLYATNAGQFGWMALNASCYTVVPAAAGTFIPIGGGIGNCNHPTLGVQAVNDVDGLQFDLNTGVLWATERNGGADFILQINPATGAVVPNSFPAVGPGVSCVTSANIPPRLDLDDIAIDPTNGDMYVVNNQGGSADLLLQINPADGTLIRTVGPFGPGNGVFDMEGLSFGILGEIMYGTTGTAGNPANSLWSVTPKTTGQATLIGPFTIGTDHEGVACMTDNVITGTVYLDVDQNALFEPANGDSGGPGVTVRLYSDNNGDGMVDAGDTLLETTTTNSAGFYFFNVATAAPFVMDIDTATLPPGAFLTTDNLEAADFRTPSFPFLFGNREENNDFGYFGLGDLDIVKTSMPSTAVGAGDTISYRIEVTNNTANRHTGISVSDVLPNGVTYTAGTTVATGPRPLQVRDEFDANSFANQDGRNNWATNWIEDANELANFPGSLQPGNVYISAGLLHLKDEPDTGTQPSVAREVDLSGGVNTARLTFDFQTDFGVDASDAVVVEISAGGIAGAYTVLETFTGFVGTNSGSRSYDISGFISATTAVRFRVSANYGAADEFFFVNDVEITADVTGMPAMLDNGGISTPQLTDGDPPGLVEPADGFILDPGQMLVVTFDVTVDDPPPMGVTSFTNLASVDSKEGLPSSDDVTNLLELPPGILTIDKTSSAAGADVVQGQNITYTLRPRADGPALLSNVQVSDPLPAGTSFVSATPTQDAGPDPVVWDIGSNLAGVPGSNSGSSGTFNEISVADSFIDENKPNDNKGNDNEMKLKNDDPDKDKRGLVRWDLTSIPAGSVVTSATMRFYINGDDAGVNVNIHRLTRSWAEGTGDNNSDVDWDHWDEGGATPPADEWATPGGDFNAGFEANFQATPQNAYKDVVVPNALIQGWLDNPSTNHGVLLDPQGTNKEVKIRTREQGSSQEPRLVVNYFTAATTTTLSTDKMVVSDGDAFTVTLTLTSTANDPTVTPGTLNIGSVSGAGATCGAAMPASQPITAGVPINFSWNCTANAAAVVDRLIFSANATGTLSTYNTGSSNSLLIGPPLTFQVTVDDPLNQNLTRILNTGTADSDETPPATDLTADPVVRGLIGDRVWLDVDGDGVQDVGEPGIANVTVELRDGMCTPGSNCPTAITDANGNYFFAYLPPGSFNVAVDVSTLPAGLAPSAGTTNPRGPSVINADEEFFHIDFGYTNAAAGSAIIGDRVWSDADNDGIQDPGEVGLAGVTVNLVGPGPDGVFGTGDDVVVAMTTTGPDGTYLFTSVAPGEYIVDVAAGVPGGYTLTTGPQSNPDPTNPITVIAGDIVTDADFGYRNPATFSISDRVWLDADGSGTQGGAEPGLAGVTVSLLNAGGEVIATTVTDANGDFSFDGLPNGDYTIQISDTDGELDGLGGTTADAMVNQRPVTVAGADVSGVNFGYNAPGVIGDTIFSDADGDGVQDPGELGIAGVTVQLWADADGDGVFDNTVDTLIDTAVTAADGTYLFAGLLPGTYFSSVDDAQPALAGYTATTTDQEGGGNAPGTQIQVDLVGINDSFLDADFGYRNNALPDVSGTVFLDSDADGTREPPGETGFAGVTVSLVSDPDGIPDTGDESILATTTTDANGDYTFPDVPAGDYQVVVTDTANILDGYTLTSGLDEIPITVAAADVTDVDFGYVRSSGSGSIGDTVWLDVDPPGPAGPDGLRGPNEAGLSMVTVRLYLDLDGDGVAEPGGDDGAAISTTITDANGNYVFTNLPPDSYFVDVDGTTLPGGLVATTGTTDPSAVIGLSDGEKFEDADFGYLPSPGTAAVGDFVWYDANGNGLQEPGETGIGGVDVTLIGDGPDNIGGTADDVTFTTTTAPDGTYLFTGLVPDEYTVFFDPATLPAGYNTIPTNTGSNSTYGVTLAAGDVITSLDWGFDGGSVGSIGDFVWLDVDGDGIQDAGEAGIPEVTLNLVGPGPDMAFGTADDEVLATTATDASGNYLFAGLPLGQSYQVQVTDVDQVLGGLNLSTAAPGTLTPTAGIPDISTADFGYAPSNGSGSIGTNFWRDLDADGFRDVGEPPIQGVTVDVWRDLNGNGTIEPGIDNLVRTVVSDFNGEFELKGLPFGDYVVDVTDTSGVLAGMSQTFGTPQVDDNSQSEPYAVTLSAAAPNNVTADFGYRDDAVDLPASIAGTAFLDAEPNGIFTDGVEVEVQNVEVLLFRILANGSRALVGRTFTDGNGDYTFSGLPPGDYEVAVKPTGTAAEGFLQTTQAATGGVQPVPSLLAGQNSTGNDFGFYDGGVTTTPVTLSYFATTADESGRVDFEWHTATEVGHVGFNLWAERDGAWQRLNDAIIPSSGADSIKRQEYRFRSDAANGSRFMLEDLDIQGRSRFHGPFELGVQRGSLELAGELIDWASIGAEHSGKRATRASGKMVANAKAGAGAVNLLVARDGVYRVSFAELEALGLNLSGSRPKIELSNRGQPVPVRIDTEQRFIEFIGEALDTLYTKTNVYAVTAPGAGSPGVIFAHGFEDSAATEVGIDPTKPNPNAAAPESYQESLRVERDRQYSFASPTGDPWFDTEILAYTSPVSAVFDLNADARVAGPVSLTVGLWGVTDFPEAPDHHVVVNVNGTALADVTFDGLVDRPVKFDVPESVLSSGANAFEVVLPGDTGVPFDLVNVDHYRVDYPRAFSARDGALEFAAAAEVFEVGALPSSEVVVYRRTGNRLDLLTGVEISGGAGNFRVRFPGSAQAATYVVASGAAILSPALEPARQVPNLTGGTAELLIISHPDFIDGLAALVQARESQGWKVKVVDVEDVYAAYGDGIFDPEAIRAYLREARDKLKTEAVLLVGGDTSDYHDYLGLGGISFIPSLYGRTGEFISFAPADGLFTDFDGDLVPELAIGRFPVRTGAELDVIIDRTLEFEAQFQRKSVLLAADDYDQPSRFDFTQASEQLASLVPGDWQVDRAYVDELGVGLARAELISRINAGAAVTSFEGHSGPTKWSFDGLFTAADAAVLQNAGKPTVVTQWGCWTTYYVSPESETLAHKLLLSGDRGAAAVLGATTLTEARSERALSLGVFRRLFVPGATLGEVVLQAKRELAAQGHPAVIDVLVGWNLLGDPTLSGFGSLHQH